MELMRLVVGAKKIAVIKAESGESGRVSCPDFPGWGARMIRSAGIFQKSGFMGRFSK